MPKSKAEMEKASAALDHGTPDECATVHGKEPHDEWYADVIQYQRETGQRVR